MNKENQRTTTYWDRAFTDECESQTRVQQIYTFASELYWELYGNRCFGVGPDYPGWLGWLHKVYGPEEPKRILELGCGTGDLTLELLAGGFARDFVAIDNSDVGLHAARQKAAKILRPHDEGEMRTVEFRSGDLNTLELEPGAFDGVIAQMSLHHVTELEHLFEQVLRSLKPYGVFAINEYVGANRWQWTDAQVALANTLLSRIPERLRRAHPDGHLKTEIGRPTVEMMIQMDPTEAVRSEDILPLYQRWFTVEHLIDYGGSISVQVLDHIVGNFSGDDPEAVKWMKYVLRCDHWARRLQLVPRTNVVIAGRKKKAVSCPATE